MDRTIDVLSSRGRARPPRDWPRASLSGVIFCIWAFLGVKQQPVAKKACKNLAIVSPFKMCTLKRAKRVGDPQKALLKC